MNSRLPLLLIAMVCGLAAMIGARYWLMPRTDPRTNTIEVLVATHDIPVETMLQPEMVRPTPWPEDNLPPGAITSFDQAAERWAKFPLLAGDPLVEGKLAPKGEPVGLRARIPPDKRAYAIEVNEQTGISGFVLPGHQVDVLLSADRNGQNKPTEAEIILQDVPVLAAGTVTTHPEDKLVEVHTVTLAVTIDEASQLAAARTRGTLSLALRGPNDIAIVDLPAHEPEPEPEPPPPPPIALPIPPQAQDYLAQSPCPCEIPCPPRPSPVDDLKYFTIYRGPGYQQADSPSAVATATPEFYGMQGLTRFTRDDLKWLYAQHHDRDLRVMVSHASDVLKTDPSSTAP